MLSKPVIHHSPSQQRFVEIAARPLRFGFIVNRQIDSEILRNIYQYNTSLWGGRFSLFVPTEGDTIREDWWKWLTFHSPDVIVLVGAFESSLVDRIYYEILPNLITHWNNSLLSLEPLKGIRAIFVDTLLNKWYHDRGSIPSTESQFRYLSTRDGNLFEWCLHTKYGLYDDGSGYQDFLEKNLGATIVHCDPQTIGTYIELQDELDSKITPLMLGSLGLELTYHALPRLGLPVVIASDQIDDLFLFHALSQADNFFLRRVRSLIVPLASIKSSDEIKTLIDACMPRMHGNLLSVASMSVDKTDLKEIGSEMIDILSRKQKRFHIDVQNCNFEPLVPNVWVDKKQQSISLSDRLLTFDFEKLPLHDHLDRHSKWIVEIDFSPRFGYRQGFVPSKSRELNILLSNYPDKRTLIELGSRARIERGRLALSVTKHERAGTLRLPSDRELVSAVCKDAGHTAIKNRSGYYEGILRLLGSISNVQHLLDPTLLSILRDRSYIKGNAFTIRNSYNRKKANKDTSYEEFCEIVQTLSGMQILLRGYNLTCPICEFATWYDLADVKEHVTCQGCRSVFQIPVESQFAYRLNTLFIGDQNQGTLATLLTLHLLFRASMYSLIWQAEITTQELKTDVDLIAMCDGVLVVAECKNFFDSKKIEKVEELLEQLRREINFAREINAQIFLFSTLTDDIPQEVVDFIAQQDQIDNKLHVRLISSEQLLSAKISPNEDDPASPVWIIQLEKPQPFYVSDECIETTLHDSPKRRLIKL